MKQRGILNIFLVLGIILVLIFFIMIAPSLIDFAGQIAPYATTSLASSWYLAFPVLFLLMIIVFALTSVA